MRDFQQEFYDFLKSSGFDPSGFVIQADDRKHRFSAAGRKDKACEYCLAINGDDFAYGWARDYRQGLFVKFTSKSSKKLSKEERERLKAEIELARAESAMRRQKEIQEAKEKAEGIWERATDGTPTEYEIRKGIKRYGARTMMGKILVVPVLDESDEIMAVQMIGGDGDKKFNKNAEKTGYWFRMGEMPPKGEDLYICEGYATGASIREATNKTVICAFDAGNLVPVAKRLGKKYNVIICADHDAATVINGQYKNIGLLRAQEAADAVAGRVCAPPSLDAEQPPRSRDFNDLHKEEGLDAVRAALGHTVQSKDIAPAEEDDNLGWKSGLITNKDGMIIPNSLVNLELFLQNHDDIKGVFAYDEFSLRVIVRKCPPWESRSSFKVHDLTSTDLTRFLIWCEHHSLKPSKDAAWDLIVSDAHENSFHPARDYFDSLKWDGIERLKHVMTEIYDCDDDERYLEIIFRKWLVGAVKRIYEPGAKFDTMLILEGPQNIGKSKSLQNLSTFNGESYFADNVKDIQNKDTIMTMQGKLIIEFAELAAWRNAETNDLKAFVSRQVDMYRPPYERAVCQIPRQCVFAGTTNPTGGYFRDATGNRRFWPVYSRKIDHSKLDEWKNQLWAEAVYLYKNNEQIWLNEDEYALATLAQEQRMQADAWMEDIQSLVAGKSLTDGFVSNGEIYQAIGIEKSKKDEYTLKRIQKVMTSLGWFEARKSIAGSKVRGWKRTRNVTIEEVIKW